MAHFRPASRPRFSSFPGRELASRQKLERFLSRKTPLGPFGTFVIFVKHWEVQIVRTLDSHHSQLAPPLWLVPPLRLACCNFLPPRAGSTKLRTADFHSGRMPSCSYNSDASAPSRACSSSRSTSITPAPGATVVWYSDRMTCKVPLSKAPPRRQAATNRVISSRESKGFCPKSRPAGSATCSAATTFPLSNCAKHTGQSFGPFCPGLWGGFVW